MTLDQGLLVVLAIAAIIGLYYTARAYLNANRRHKMGALRLDLNAWAELIFVEDAFIAPNVELELTHSSTLTDGYQAARAVVGRRFCCCDEIGDLS